jgi:uncharacterized protein
MRHDLVDILACPVCKQELTLHVEREDGGEVMEGRLECAACPASYPIAEGIPNLLPPDLRQAMEAEEGSSGGAR